MLILKPHVTPRLSLNCARFQNNVTCLKMSFAFSAHSGWNPPYVSLLIFVLLARDTISLLHLQQRNIVRKNFPLIKPRKTVTNRYSPVFSVESFKVYV